MKKFVKNLFAKKPTKPTRPARQLSVEMLEDRLVLDATSVFQASSGFIIVHGTDLADAARVIQQGDKVWVYTGTSILPGVWKDYQASQVKGIAFHGHDGHDTFYNETSIASYMYLGEGNDTFFSGHGNDVVFCGGGDDYGTGGLGNDSIRGEGGDDYLRGFMGNDTICGNDGWDELYGEWGNDLIFGGAGDIKNTDGCDSLFGGDGSDILEAGRNEPAYAGHVPRDILYGNDSEAKRAPDTFILSNGIYDSQGKLNPYDHTDRRGEDYVHHFHFSRSGEKEYQSTNRIDGVMARELDLAELEMLPEELDFFLPEIDPMAMVAIDDLVFDGIIPDELLESTNAKYFSQDPALVELGPEAVEIVSLFDTVDDQAPLDLVEVIDLPISLFEEEAALDETDLVTMSELDAVSIGDALEAPPLEINNALLAPVTGYASASSATTKVASYKIMMW